MSPRNIFVSSVLGLALLLMAPLSAQAVNGKISLTPSSDTLTPGQSQQVSLALDEPIICSDPNVVCEVSLDFSASQALGVTVTPAVVNWPANQWFQPRLVTIALDINTVADYPQIVTLSARANSASEYYANYQVSLPVNIDVPDRRTTPTPSAIAGPSLAVTGVESTSAMAIFGGGVMLVVSGGFVAAATRKRSRQS